MQSAPLFVFLFNFFFFLHSAPIHCQQLDATYGTKSTENTLIFQVSYVSYESDLTFCCCSELDWTCCCFESDWTFCCSESDWTFCCCSESDWTFCCCSESDLTFCCSESYLTFCCCSESDWTFCCCSEQARIAGREGCTADARELSVQPDRPQRQEAVSKLPAALGGWGNC